MNKIKAALMLLIILVAAYFLFAREKETDKEQNAQGQLILPELSKDSIFYLGVSHKTGIFEVELIDQRWMLIDPKGTPADAKKVQELLERLVNLKATRILEKDELETDNAAYGFSDADMYIALEEKEGQKRTKTKLIFGKLNPLNNARYAKILDQQPERVYLVENFEFEFFKLNKEDVWDARPLFYKISDLKELEINEIDKRTFAIKRNGESSFEVEMEGNAFNADTEVVLKTLESIANLKINQSPSNEITNLLANSLSSPTLVLNFKFTNGNTRSVLFGEEKVSGSSEQNYYFKIKENPLVYRFSGRFLNDLVQGLEHFEKRLPFENLKEEEISQISIDAKPSENKTALIEELRRLRILNYAAASKKYSAKDPELSLEISFFSGETAELSIGKSVGSLQAGEANIDAPRFAILKKDGKNRTVVISAETAKALIKLKDSEP